MSEWLKDSLTSLRKIENKEVKNNKKSKFLKKVLTTTTIDGNITKLICF